jgi:hypothetical protein
VLIRLDWLRSETVRCVSGMKKYRMPNAAKATRAGRLRLAIAAFSESRECVPQGVIRGQTSLNAVARAR